MLGSISSVFSGLTNVSKRFQNSANNLSNVLTSGFKKSQLNNVDSKVGGTGLNSISRVNTQGGFLPTNNPLDLAIQGNGFFQIANSNGNTSFTRSGSFSLGDAGQMIDSSGNPLAPAINIPFENNGISVSYEGRVSAKTSDGTVAVGQIQLASFTNPSGLTAAGGNLFNESASSGAPAIGIPGAGNNGTIISGFLESSNVDITEEMVDQINTKATFKANINIIKAKDEMLGSIIDIKK